MVEASDAQLKSEAAARSQQVQSLLNGKRSNEAIRKALESPPFTSKDQSVKDFNAETVSRALSSCSEAEIQGVVDALSDEECDVLMKYIYRGLALAQNSAQLFKWHSKVVEKVGLGCIVRAMVDRQTA